MTRYVPGQTLSDPSHYPLFAKPIDGMYSVGALSLTSVESEWIHLANGEAVPINAVADFIVGWGEAGYLLQDRVEPHPVLRAAFGGTLPSARFLVLLSPEGPAIESVVLKIPSARNPADNYWRPGNMLGAIDMQGVVQRVVTGVGMNLREVTIHPDTLAPLAGLNVPEWDRAVDLCRRAASMFPGIRTQSWDVAFSENGPTILEINFGGDLNLHQLAHDRGALTDTYVNHLRRCGVRGI